MQPSKRDAPGPALAPEVPSNDTYSNTLKDNTIDCKGSVTLSKTWDPVKKATGTTNANGQPIEEYVPYDANDLEGQMDVKDLSNDWYRNFQLFFGRGGIKCTEEGAKNAMLSLNADGENSSKRATPYADLMYYKGQLLSKVALSLNQADKTDTVVQDYQVIWSCSGTCQELSNKSTGSSCRPVFLSEVIYGLQSEPIYYSAPGADPTTFPGNILTAVNSHYSGTCGDYGCYSKRSKGSKFSPLSKSTYELIFKQINFTPRGNVNNKVTVVNWDGYNTVARQKINPTPTTFNRTLPNAATAYSPDAGLAIDRVNPSKQEALPNSSLCDDVKVSSDVSVDKPLPALIGLFVHGTFQRVPAGESYSHSESIEVTSTYDKGVIVTTQNSEQAFLNMLPSSVGKQLVSEPFSSKTSVNQNNPIPDPGKRATLLLKEMTRQLRPSTWF